MGSVLWSKFGRFLLRIRAVSSPWNFELNFCCHRKVKHLKKVGEKGRQIFFSDKAKQRKVGAKKRQIFFSGRAKQNKVGSKERLGCPALMLEKKRDNQVTLFLQLYFVSLYH